MTYFDNAEAGLLTGTYLAEVVSVQDPDSLSRVQIRLLSADGVDGHDAPIWARVAVPFGGNNYGAFMIPDVGDEVLVSFVQGDSRMPVVVGSLWSGSATPPEQLGGDRVDRWTMVGKNGTRIAMIEESSSTIIFETVGGVKGTLTDDGSKIELVASDSTVTMEPGTIEVQTGGEVKVTAGTVKVTAGMVTVDAAMADFSGLVKCQVLQATTVIASTYTPGAGNVW
jgi:phage baseplate assembly protein gpV